MQEEGFCGQIYIFLVSKILFCQTVGNFIIHLSSDGVENGAMTQFFMHFC